MIFAIVTSFFSFFPTLADSISSLRRICRSNLHKVTSSMYNKYCSSYDHDVTFINTSPWVR